MRSALEAYDKEYYTFTIADIEMLTDVRIERNKRNYQKQEWHLDDMRGKKARMKNRGQTFKNPEGRPDKEQIIKEYIQAHPDARVTDIAKALGVSRPTVYKYKNKEI
jgi:DNA invertase Pin-like site-specific DNA recombinase